MCIRRQEIREISWRGVIKGRITLEMRKALRAEGKERGERRSERKKRKANPRTDEGESMRGEKGDRKQNTTLILKHSMRKFEGFWNLEGRQKYGRKGEKPQSTSEFLPKTALNRIFIKKYHNNMNTYFLKH